MSKNRNAKSDAPAGADETGASDELHDEPASPDAVSAAPPRAPAELESHLQLLWDETKAFVSRVEGSVDGELGEFLEFVRKKM
jgi:hypothetical protein